MQVKTLHFSKNVLSTLVTLVEQYKDRDEPASCYLDNSLANYPDLEENELTCVIELFLGIHRYEEFLCKVVDYFYCLTKRTDHKDKIILIAVNYLILFVVNRDVFDKIKEVLMDFDLKKGKQILQFYNRKDVYNDLLEAGCAYFDYEFVTDKILKIFSTDKNIFKDLLNDINSCIEVNDAKKIWKPTVAVSPRHAKYTRKVPPPPCNTPMIIFSSKPEPLPETTYKQPALFRRLEAEKLRNKDTSTQLFNEAQEHAPSMTRRQPLVLPPEPEVKPYKPISKPKISTPEVPVKPNATTLLREAARIIKEEEKEIKKLEALEAGGANYTKYECLMREIRDEEEKLHLQEIERKHLQGLLTREEAIIAKHKLKNENKMKRNRLEEEKRNLNKYMKEMRKHEEEKMKSTIDKVQLVQKNIEVKRENLQKQRNKTAHEVSEASKQLWEEAVKRRKEELDERMAVIEEIKALNCLREQRAIEFDPSETMNIGLMCEMSLAELQERLIILRIDLQEDLEKRQNKIKQKRFKQQKFLTETKEFLDIHREYRKQLVTSNEEREKKKKKMVPDSCEISELRSKLKEARSRRHEIKSQTRY